jgi:FkbM family methyltransferase
MLRQLAPLALHRLLEYRRRFRALELPERWALSRDARAALVDTNLELLPPAVRQRPACVVDVGANVGEWSLGMIRLAQPQRIVAIEPIPGAFAQLRTLSAAHPEMRCIEAAAGAHAGHATLHVEERSKLSSLRVFRDEVRDTQFLAMPPKAVEVRVDTLDSLLKDEPHISVLKVDVQGAQAEVIAGAPDTLRKTDVLLMEVMYLAHYHGESTFSALHNLIESAPLRLWGISAPVLGANGRPEWADAVYVHERLAS